MRGNEVKSLEGKMSALGWDASKGTGAGMEGVEWEKAVSRSTRLKHVRRVVRRDVERGAEGERGGGGEASADGERKMGAGEEEGIEVGNSGDATLPEEKEEGELDRADEESYEGVNGEGEGWEEEGNETDAREGIEEGGAVEGEMSSEVTSEGGAGGESEVEGRSEFGWSEQSVLESSVGCLTADFAMQNVILQMGLRLLTVDGVQIRELHR